jgi:response regulator RpfG family c-di-GMP phosphodiesterase
MKSPEKIIIIDDNILNNKLCIHLLKKYFSTVLEISSFTSPEIGIEHIISTPKTKSATTLLLLDINMPTLSGWEVLEELDNFLQASRDNFYVFILSSSVDSRDHERAHLSPHVTAILEKPLTSVQLDLYFKTD